MGTDWELKPAHVKWNHSQGSDHISLTPLSGSSRAEEFKTLLHIVSSSQNNVLHFIHNFQCKAPNKGWDYLRQRKSSFSPFAGWGSGRRSPPSRCRGLRGQAASSSPSCRPPPPPETQTIHCISTIRQTSESGCRRDRRRCSVSNTHRNMKVKRAGFTGLTQRIMYCGTNPSCR